MTSERHIIQPLRKSFVKCENNSANGFQDIAWKARQATDNITRPSSWTEDEKEI